MFEFADLVIQNRRPILASAAVIFVLVFIGVLAPVVQASADSITPRSTQSSYDSTSAAEMYDSPNAVASGLSAAGDYVGHSLDVIQTGMLSGIVTTASGITHAETTTAHGVQTAATGTVRTIGTGFAYMGYTAWSGFASMGHGIGSGFGAVFGLTHLSSVIQPGNQVDDVPVIQLRARQAALIQSGTTDVVVAASNGSGGACDNGNGNGSYPDVWCNAPMDTLATVYGNYDRINRECTSYAYWYFTSVEGHADFEVSEDAKYWASTTNYPVHYTPQVGAIAVETGGAYGHVAIVQALPGQTYAGQVVPAGDVLVSEMNYDWQGHFRYSYSPLSKFSAYIYQ